MTLVPDFEFGLWNAWIIIVASLVAGFLPLMVWGNKPEARMEGEPDFKDTGPAYRIGMLLTHAVLMPATLLYGFFVPLERGNWWLYSGLIVSGIGIIMMLTASVTFATAPLGEPMTHGVYSISRNPMYLASFLVYAGVGLAGTSWVFLLFALLVIAGFGLAVPEEERVMVAKYGAAYEEYMRRTPRWIGLPRARQPVGV